MGKGMNNVLMAGFIFNSINQGIENSAENKKQAEKIAKLEAKLAIPKDASTVEKVIAYYLIDNEGEDKDMEYKILVTQFTKLAVTCEEMFPDINIAGVLLDDIVTLTKYGKGGHDGKEKRHDRKEFMTRLILDMRIFISRNKDSIKEIKNELGNFQYKMEYDINSNKIAKIIWDLMKYRKNIDTPFYVKGTKVKIDVAGFDSKFGKYKTKEEAKKMAVKLNKILELARSYEKQMGNARNRGMIIDLAMNPGKVKTYKLELKGTKLGEFFGV